MKKKVAVAMSGGVDSSVAALLLQRQGYEVIGISMLLSPYQEERDGLPTCCGFSDIADARKVAHYLGIRHYVVNFKDIFQRYVIDNFIQQYSHGLTPNPCICCNRYIKFDRLLKRVREIGADYLATGHYARIVFEQKRTMFFLKRGVDKDKDQSYVLYNLNQKNLGSILMPLGELTKKEVRYIAREENLPVALKPESQEVCFVPGSYTRFLEQNAPYINRPGFIVNSKGDILGRHRGIAFFTIGQRHGIGISSPHPLYVIGIDSLRNEIIVGHKEEVYSRELDVEEINIVADNILMDTSDVMVKIRYLHKPAPATVSILGKGRCRIIFKEPQWGITPGQSAVFYNGDIVVGGGIIKKI